MPMTQAGKHTVRKGVNLWIDTKVIAAIDALRVGRESISSITEDLCAARSPSGATLRA